MWHLQLTICHLGRNAELGLSKLPTKSNTVRLPTISMGLTGKTCKACRGMDSDATEPLQWCYAIAFLLFLACTDHYHGEPADGRCSEGALPLVLSYILTDAKKCKHCSMLALGIVRVGKTMTMKTYRRIVWMPALAMAKHADPFFVPKSTNASAENRGRASLPYSVRLSSLAL